MKVSRRLGYSLAVLAAATLMSRSDAAEMTPASLKAVEAKVQAVVAKALPCTVALISKRTGAAGSGVVVSEDGLILTAGHVTRATGDELVVYFPDGKTAEATALGADYQKDSGMARIVDEGRYPFVELGESGTLEENQWCVALGHTAGYQADRTPPVRLGRILAERVGDFISTDCALTGGDSGGPQLAGIFKKNTEFYYRITYQTRVGGFTIQICFNKIINYFSVKCVPNVKDLNRNIDLSGNFRNMY